MLNRLNGFNWQEAKRALRNGAAGRRHVSVIETALSDISMYASSAVRELSEIPARIESLDLSSLKDAMFFVDEAARAGFPSVYPAEPGRIRLTVRNYTNCATHLRQRCADAEAGLADLLKSFDPSTYAAR